MDFVTLRTSLNKPYQRNNWIELLPKIFGQQVNVDLKAERINIQKTNAKTIERFAAITLTDNKNIAVLDIETSSDLQIIKNRVALREMAYQLIDQDRYHGLLVFYYNRDRQGSVLPDYRLSFISKETLIDDNGSVKEKSTHPKRYTYILGTNESCTTTAQRFLELKAKANNSKNANKGIALNDVTEAFSVSTLTKQFYNELFKWYEWALSEDVGITFPKNTTTSEDDREKLEEQIIRLITRLLFVWFIKQKQLVPNNLFDTKELKNILQDFDPTSKTSGNYYNAILQNLFFATLNKSVKERGFAKEENIRDIKTLYRYSEMFSLPEKKVLELFKAIPFLNGGLFECLDKEIGTDGVKYHLDGFSRSDKKLGGHFKHRAFIPNSLFFDEENGILPLLQRYNFTVEENNPDDAHVALDPELLGNVFENLLGAYNPETKESARKQSGSFYTPKEIVDFMVSESLIAYLQNAFEQQEDTIRSLLENEELPVELKDNKKLCSQICEKLKAVKIIDPACGSGAFPMGILKKMVEVLGKLEPKKTTYDQKLHLIEECIYGVDIQTIAAQISKLRFFISLIVEQGEMDLSRPEENYGVITLPNLETKFVAANTLIGLHKKPAQTNLFEDPRIEIVKKEILEVRHQHFYAKTAKDKRTLREKDTKLRTELVVLLEANHEFAPEDAKQVAKWNPYDQNDSSPFFDTEWMFGLKNGFDIVIGNPPYIQLQQNGSELAKVYVNSQYKTFDRSGDIYSLFYEKGWHLLKPKGVLCYITSNGWMRNGYGENTRSFFAEQTNPILLIDFAGQKIFESATVEVNILMFTKDKNQQQTKACIVKEKLLNNLSVFVRQQGTECNFSTKESWVILSPIEQRIKSKIEAIGTPLKDWDINIYRGVLTGYNEAFIIDGTTKDKLIKEDAKSAEIIRPILRGRDIKKYGYEWADKYVICARLITDIPKNYPAICKYLERFKGKGQLGDNSTTKVFNRPWWSWMQEPVKYWDDFSKQKIVWGNLNLKASYALAPEGIFVNAPCPMIVPANKYLLAMLNSKLADFYIRILAKKRNGGYIEYKPMFIERLPVPNISEKEQARLISLVEKIHSTDVNIELKTVEKEIDNLIFKLYDLTEEEIHFIDYQ